MIPHSKPTITQGDIQAVTQTLATGMIAQGAIVGQFERSTASFLQVREGVAVNSGTAALHLALLTLDIGPGDEVILPSYVCTAPLNAIRYTGATPVLSDIDSNSGNIDPKSIATKISSKTKAVIVPHMLGHVADLTEIKHCNIPIIEDCAQAIGAKFQGKSVGSFGDVTICSFYATKVMTSGEGGMVLANDPEIMKRVRDLRDYDEKLPYKTRYNYKMTDMQASLGLSQLRRLPDFIETRRKIAAYYDDHFSSLPTHSPTGVPGSESIYFRYVLLLDSGENDFVKKMASQKVICRRPVFRPLHSLLAEQCCEQAEAFHKSAVSLPIYPLLSEPELEKIVGSVKTILG